MNLKKSMMIQSSGGVFVCAGKGTVCPEDSGGGDRQEEGGTWASA